MVVLNFPHFFPQDIAKLTPLICSFIVLVLVCAQVATYDFYKNTDFHVYPFHPGPRLPSIHQFEKQPCPSFQHGEI